MDMELKDLRFYIEENLKKHNIGSIEFMDNFFQSYIEIKDFGYNTICIDKFLGHYRIEVKDNAEEEIFWGQIREDENGNTDLIKLVDIINLYLTTDTEDNKQDIVKEQEATNFTFNDALDLFKDKRIYFNQQHEGEGIVEITPDENNEGKLWVNVFTDEGKKIKFSKEDLLALESNNEVVTNYGIVQLYS